MRLFFLLLMSVAGLSAGGYVGDDACKTCHTQEHKKWQGSHHDLAMQEATEKTVLGDFTDAAFEYNGIVSTFFKKGDAFMVRTDGPDGKLHDYEITHTFGLYPLQQYMVPFDGGRLQVLDIAWDSRTKEEGGQRWYHLHPHEDITAEDVLHWTGPNLNWNYMCADCHSTNLKKGYDQKTKSYHTTFDVINVSCEACHGPGSEHLKWAKEPKAYKGMLKDGLSIDLSTFEKERWKIDPKSGKPVLLTEVDHSEVQLCAKCHSRRSQLDDDFVPGDAFEEHYLPTTLTEQLYFADGKIKDEVYVYGSFRQSKMYEQGVTCTDCHDAHSLERRAVGDQVCDQCHRRVDHETKAHHKHPKGTAGCIDCHMPARTYMGVDERNDHSFRVPRPDLSIGTDIPNACNNCHDDKDAAWAAKSMKAWYGEIPVGKQDFSHGLKALRDSSEEAPQLLYEILMSDAPDIAKATAIPSLGAYPSQQTYTTVMQMLRSKDAVVRLSALRALETFPPQTRVKQTFAMLDDPLKSVRTEAARQLSSLPQGEMDMTTRSKLSSGIDEYKETLLFNADRAESQTALGALYVNLGEFAKAEAAYDEALRLQPQYVPAYVNLVHYHQGRGEEQKAYELLQRGMGKVSGSPDLHHILGLWYIRQKESAKALAALKRATELDSDDARYHYVYAVALAEEDVSGAIKVLESSLKRHTGDIQTLFALAFYHKQLGEMQKAKDYQKRAEKLSQFVPDVMGR